MTKKNKKVKVSLFSEFRFVAYSIWRIGQPDVIWQACRTRKRYRGIGNYHIIIYFISSWPHLMQTWYYSCKANLSHLVVLRDQRYFKSTDCVLQTEVMDIIFSSYFVWCPNPIKMNRKMPRIYIQKSHVVSKLFVWSCQNVNTLYQTSIEIRPNSPN